MYRRVVRNISSEARPGSYSVSPPVRDEGVAAQPLDVHGTDRHAGEVRVAPDVVEIVDREDARQKRLEPADPARHRRVGDGRLRDQERDPRGIDRLAGGEGVPFRDGARRPPQAADQRRQLVLDDPLREVLVASAACRPDAARIRRRREGGQDLLVEEVGERAVSDVVEEARDPERLDDEPLRRRRPSRRRRASSAGSDTASAPTAPASCITPRPWVNRECSAVGKTQRALWSWLIRRSRWTQAVSSRSSSATSSSGRPDGTGFGRRSAASSARCTRGSGR